jgi:hypothetical protein
MSKSLLDKEYVAEAAILAFRIVKPGSTDDFVSTGAAATDKVIGVVEGVAPALGERCAVVVAGLADVTFGGTVARGDPLTCDASGRAVVAAPAAGSNVRLIGFARVSGVVGDVGEILVQQGLMQG